MYNNLYVTHRPVLDLFDLLASNLRWAGQPSRSRPQTRGNGTAPASASTQEASTANGTGDSAQGEQNVEGNANASETAGDRVQAAKPERVLRPHVRIHETKEHYRLIADLPGAQRDTIAVDVENGELSLSAPRLVDTEDAPVTVRYYRRFALPDKIDAQGIDASYDNGVLQVVIPKLVPPQVRINVH